MEVMKIQGVGKRYGRRWALKDINVDLQSGEILGIIGESGSGKTTLLRTMAGLVRPNRGEVLLENRPIQSHQKDFYQNVQMIFQDARSSFDPQKTIGQSFDEVQRHLCNVKVDNGEHLAKVGLSSECEHCYPHQLSGGQCQRAAIARALLVMPKVLLCDEITSALDVCVQKSIIELLVDLRKSNHISVVFVSHNLALVSNFCDRILIMYDGEIVEQGRTEEVLHHPKNSYTKDLLGHILLI